MSHLLVLGGGWVGSAVAAAGRCRADVDRVSVIDPPFDPLLARRDGAATAELVRLIRDLGVTSVVNACGRVQGSDGELTDANQAFAEWLCDTLLDTRVRLVHVGSASEYGDPGSPTPIDESIPARPVGQYATTKAAGTRAVLRARTDGLDATVARVFNLVGHPVPSVSPIHQWLTDLRALPPGGGVVEVWWPPTTRDFVMVEDAAVALCDLALSEAVPPPLINVCSGTGLTFGEIVGELASGLGAEAAIRSLDRPGIETVLGDPTLLRATIGWSPTMSVRDLARRALGVDPSTPACEPTNTSVPGGGTGTNR